MCAYTKHAFPVIHQCALRFIPYYAAMNIRVKRSFGLSVWYRLDESLVVLLQVTCHLFLKGTCRLFSLKAGLVGISTSSHIFLELTIGHFTGLRWYFIVVLIFMLLIMLLNIFFPVPLACVWLLWRILFSLWPIFFKIGLIRSHRPSLWC